VGDDEDEFFPLFWKKGEKREDTRGNGIAGLAASSPADPRS
jgi:hypothetical protein